MPDGEGGDTGRERSRPGSGRVSLTPGPGRNGAWRPVADLRGSKAKTCAYRAVVRPALAGLMPLLLAVALSAPLTPVHAQGKARANTSADNTARSAPPASLVRVDAVRVEPLVQTMPVIGRLVARKAGEIAARIAGSVAEFRVEVGDRVEKGDVIALLDPETLQVRKLLSAGALAEAEADLVTSRAEVKLARQEVDRLAGLRNSVAFPQGRYDDARQRVTVAEARAARARATVSARRASLDLADLNLRYSRIAAPYSGIVVRRLTEVGAYARAGDAVVRLIGDKALEAEADVPSARLGGLTPGTVVGVTLDNGRRLKASVRAVLPSENPLTRTRTVRFVPEFGGDTGGLADAQSVTVHVPAGKPRSALTVHKDAIIKKASGDTVFVIDNGKASPRAIRLGEASGARMEVLGGLKSGDKVVVRGNERLRPGAAVRIDSGT